MSDINQTSAPDDQALEKEEKALDAEIGLAAGLAETALAHIQRMSNAGALNAVNNTLNLLTSFLPEAERLRNQNRAAVHTRLTLLLEDVTAARNTWAKTLGILVEGDRADMQKRIDHRAAAAAQQKKLNEERSKQAQDHAAENKKLL